jgi:type VI secretion system protein ImpL
MGVYWVTSGVLLAYLVLVWFLGTWLPLHGPDRWILRGGLALIGLLGAGTFIWFHRKSKAKQEGVGGEPAYTSGAADVDLLVHEALRRLRNSTLARGATLHNLPLVFLLGDSGAAKTTTILHSALDPDLLAGHVYQDDSVLPTRVANIWYTRQAIFVDPAGGLLAQTSLWKRLVKLVQPGRVSTVLGGGQQAPRAAVVCFDCGNFLEAGASESTLVAARGLAARLQDISHILSISFPVYVLFTKLDRISFFSEFVRGFSDEETSQVLGATLPVRSLTAGVYAEEETRRLTKAFDVIFYSLAEKRLDLLTREFETDKLPGIYEFPRELRKVRVLLVRFLVDLARPSQLSVNPFLRGFYFCGVRPVIVDDVVPATPQAQAADDGLDGGATRIFVAGGPQTPRAANLARAPGSRKVPQWVFLTQLFNGVIVKDRVAFAASGFSARVSLLRRVVLVSILLGGIVFAIGFLVSFVGNHSLESDVRIALHGAQTIQAPAANQVASLTDLQKLDRLRRELVTLSEYEREGPPWHLRWGLYVGARIYKDARSVYFDQFHQLLFGVTKSRLLSHLGAVPNNPGPHDSYENTYNELKAYLITTSNNDKSTKEFLSPQLVAHWFGDTEIDADRVDLARQQFDFYSTELAASNPYPSANDGSTIEHVRGYLSQFPVVDRFYSQLLSQASGKYSDVSFNEKFPDSIGVIISNYRVRGAFTRNGFGFMQDAIRNPSNYMSAEDWVLGKVSASELEQSTLQKRLIDKYHQDFIREWRTVLLESKVAPYKSLRDAGKKLDKLTNPSSPLLELLWFVSNNTNIESPDVSNPFLPVQAVAPPGPADKLPDQYEIASTKPYIEALAQLRSAIDTLLQNPGDETLIIKTLNSAGAAKVSITQVMGTRVDQAYHTENRVRQLLEEPITNAESLLRTYR